MMCLCIKLRTDVLSRLYQPPPPTFLTSTQHTHCQRHSSNLPTSTCWNRISLWLLDCSCIKMSHKIHIACLEIFLFGQIIKESVYDDMRAWLGVCEALPERLTRSWSATWPYTDLTDADTGFNFSALLLLWSLYEICRVSWICDSADSFHPQCTRDWHEIHNWMW